MRNFKSVLDALEDFKSDIQERLSFEYRKRYSADAYTNVIHPCLENMLEDLEAHMEIYATDAMQADALLYDDMEGE